MHFEKALPIMFFVIFALVVGSFVFKSFKYGGFKAAMFGAPIERTIGEVDGGSGKIMSIKVKVHMLGGNSPDKAIGLEFVAKSLTSYDMIPITLSAPEAKKLVGFIQLAAGDNAE